MPVKVGKTAGFCWGVRRAMDIVLDVANLQEDDLYTIGPIIHNNQVTQMLSSKQVTISDDLSQKPQATAVVRTHGIAPQKLQALEAGGAILHDATCPYVLRIHGIIRKYIAKGWDIVIVGDRGHAEVNGLYGSSNEQAYIVENEEEAAALPHLERACIVSQTTHNQNSFAAAIEQVKKIADQTEVFNTICEDTDERQSELVELGNEVDAMVIIGGPHSANTTRLAAISQRGGTPTVKIETEAELDAAWVRPFETIGVMAGASTPTWIIRNVVDALETMQRAQRPWPLRALHGAVRSATASFGANALGALCLAFAGSLWLGAPLSAASMALAFCLLFSLLVFAHLAEGQTTEFDDPFRRDLFERRRTALRVAAGAAGLASLALAGSVSLTAAGVALALFVLAHVTHPQRLGLRSLHKSNAKRIWGMAYRHVMIGGGWLCAGMLMPWLMRQGGAAARSGMTPGSVTLGLTLGITGLVAFGLPFLNNTLLDLGDMEADRIGGRSSLPILIGETAASRLLHIGNAALMLATIAGVALGALPPVALAVAAPLGALSLLREAQRRNLYFTRNTEETLVAGVLPLFALVTLLIVAF